METVKEKLINLIGEAVELYSSEYEITADYLIQNGVTIQEWVSVDERLPIDEVNRYREKYHGEFPEFIVLIKDALEPTCLTFTGDSWVDRMGDFYTVSYWQPLPQPPKEVQ